MSARKRAQTHEVRNSTVADRELASGMLENQREAGEQRDAGYIREN